MDYIIKNDYSMISAIAEQNAIAFWEYIIDPKDNSRYWFWPAPPQDKRSAELVHVGSPIRFGRRSDGYGGRNMDFLTKDGVITIQGPWHGNADALFDATGIDIRDRFWTWGVIAMGRSYSNNQTIYKDVIYIDPDDGKIGLFDRVELIAKAKADELNKPVYCYRKSSGGSSEGPVLPPYWTETKRSNYYKRG